MLSDRNGLPPAALSAANVDGPLALKPLVMAVSAVRTPLGPRRVDRAKPGSEVRVLSERNGLPPAVLSAANVDGPLALKPLVMAVPAVRTPLGPRRRRPDKLHADKAYDQGGLRQRLRDRGIADRIARKRTDTSNKLGRHRQVIERTFAWLTGYRRLTLRYERNASHFLAFLTPGATPTCYMKLTKITT